MVNIAGRHNPAMVLTTANALHCPPQQIAMTLAGVKVTMERLMDFRKHASFRVPSGAGHDIWDVLPLADRHRQ